MVSMVGCCAIGWRAVRSDVLSGFYLSSFSIYHGIAIHCTGRIFVILQFYMLGLIVKLPYHGHTLLGLTLSNRRETRTGKERNQTWVINGQCI